MLGHAEIQHLARLALRLRDQYRRVLSASPGYGQDKTMTKEMDSLGSLVKEIQDVLAVVVIDQEGSDVPGPRGQQEHLSRG